MAYCKCSQRSLPLGVRRWYVVQYKSDIIAHDCPGDPIGETVESKTSLVQCAACSARWRTKGKYVYKLESVERKIIPSFKP